MANAFILNGTWSSAADCGGRVANAGIALANRGVSPPEWRYATPKPNFKRSASCELLNSAFQSFVLRAFKH